MILRGKMLMNQLKCIFCGRQTTIHRINAQRKISGKIVTLSNAPVYYCAPCKETFFPKETQDVFKLIQERNLQDKTILFQYDDMKKKVY